MRRREVYASLIALTDCEDLKAVLRNEAQRNGREAWRILERECGEPTSALHINKKVLEWHGLTMAKDVGISASSIACAVTVAVATAVTLGEPQGEPSSVATTAIIIAITFGAIAIAAFVPATTSIISITTIVTTVGAAPSYWLSLVASSLQTTSPRHVLSPLAS